MSDIQSPLPGTFYHQASPEEPPFKSEGDDVAVGDVIGLIEVMKTFIQVTAETSGVFVAYKVDNASPVTAGDVVAELK
ncbi:acetyl-CoA carboxylase [Pseudooceanicola nitratireducens]|jgi:biotin carboxyl carrier protein|uniref:Biotin carboxyl carrier protein of acetyl-CoA carboxylase n=1 Tax=Pseudooceanicola nitratireducens TaxID=517719 RepID=A0A1I1QR77_9RHOB|nr:acetyl-CoA carboxylase [Pseudooceanicola nitratireducens]MEC7795157.1 acetyl-CoA carboxylase [Pseudomonadota bacterium]MBY6167674.1 biotin carboxyl carrier domain-containing protein [Pseudooceanicola nitratireducens]MEC8668565.1 acetyl-CoA carboxylase [Pseudomonadota bacterium]SEJ76266.1 Biotin-requiring enzyme [Pseudooceanicola nitratireducens]SFD24611.1 biotin carboxyl carrier protein [Pseudooceanicola nitratireducens]